MYVIYLIAGWHLLVKLSQFFFESDSTTCMNGIILKFYNCRVVNLFWPTFWLTSRNICNILHWSAFIIYFFFKSRFLVINYFIISSVIVVLFMLGEKKLHYLCKFLYLYRLKNIYYLECLMRKNVAYIHIFIQHYGKFFSSCALLWTWKDLVI